MAAQSPATIMEQHFLAAAQASGGIQPLLKHFFEFMHTKTDFYVVDPRESRPMGFPEGAAEALVRKRNAMETPSKLHHKSVASLQVMKAFRSFPMKNPDGSIRKQEKAVKQTTPVPKPAAPAAAPKPRILEGGSQMPVGNGGVGPGGAYTWTHTLSDVTVTLPVPASIKSSQVSCKFTPGSIELTVAGADPPVNLTGTLGGDVRPGDCLWTIERGSSAASLTVTLDKGVQTWWRCVVEGHPTIDATKVDSTRPVTDYDEETQASIRKLVVSVRLGDQWCSRSSTAPFLSRRLSSMRSRRLQGLDYDSLLCPSICYTRA